MTVVCLLNQGQSWFAMLLAGLGILTAGCSSTEPVVNEEMMRVQDGMPVDFSGDWERDYSRGDDADAVLRSVYYQLSRNDANQQRYGGAALPSERDMAKLMPLAQLAELITRPDVLKILQDDNEILVEREEDFAITCTFYDGVAKATISDYGTEICGWDGNQLVSNLMLRDGLQVTHRFTISESGENLRIVTTVSSPTSRLPFTLARFYRKFEWMPSKFNCVETLSK